MATEFNLPDSPPPGNTFPLTSTAGGQRASIVKLAKGQPRAIVVEVNEGSPRSSEEEEPKKQPDTSAAQPKEVSNESSSAEHQDDANALSEAMPGRSRPHPQLTIHTGPPPPPPANPQGSHSQASSMTLHDGADAPAPVDDNDQTPVMRSMFPRFDPEVRMSRQDYMPSVDLLPPPPPLLPGMRSSRPSSQVSYVPAQNSPMPSPYLGPQRVMSPPAIQGQPVERGEQELSSPEELLDLWTIANGQLCPEAKDSYVLGLEWYVFMVTIKSASADKAPVTRSPTITRPWNSPRAAARSISFTPRAAQW
jgi:hypothetical protein